MSIDKHFVKQSFNASAPVYDRFAGLQRSLAERVLDFIQPPPAAAPLVLDIGIGTGNLSAALRTRMPDSRIIGCDLAERMLVQARAKLPGTQVLTADAELLPVRDHCCDLALSSFTYQWLESWDRALAEAARVLKPGGLLVFSAFGARTFHELRTCYQTACAETGYQGGSALRLHSRPDVMQQALRRTGFSAVTVSAFDAVEWYPDVATLARAIKGMGSRNASPGRNRTPGVRRVWRAMVDAYEQRYRTAQGIPATFEVILGRGTLVSK